MKTRVLILAAAWFASVAVSTGAKASASSDMNAFWDGSLGSANVTGPTAYQGQAAGYYTLGNFAMRGPQESANVAAIQMPSVRAGCGGIDLFTGGFSFISSEQLVAMLKATASNAISYAFMLAIKSLSPIIADQMESLAKVAQDINSFNMSSCESAQALVASVWTRGDLASKQICQDLGAYRGFYSDRIQSRHGCGSQGSRMATLGGLPETDKKAVPINKNIAWEAIKQHPLLASDRELGELFMTLTGTIITRCPANDDSGCAYDVLPAEARDRGVISAVLDGGTIRAHRCDETTNCLNPGKFGQNITVASTSALRPRVAGLLSSISTKIRNRQALDATERDFLNMVSLPVYKMASVYTAQQGAFAANAMAQYADIIALDLVYTWMAQSVGRVEDGARNLVGVDPEQLREWRSSTEAIHAYLLEAQTNTQVRASALDAMIARTMQAEQVLAARLGNRVGDSLAFSATLAPN
jgi:conjugative transfer pilus assembly protein TraH